eukprot:TRINITY_DN30234_c0_g1_i1.p2 TRINITY_DN30234_c0_g1~~TRINITY_DN30234_c0_g1_i1.p2  ORF type:complete len:353 (+),score=79.32 TRINITY_DN30234_c0_g1_i1:69-1127(+)
MGPPIAMVNHYEVLGVPPRAAAADIRKAYHRLALETHPDRHRDLEDEGREAQARRFRAAQASYEVLASPKQRRAFDKEREERGRQVEKGLRRYHSTLHPDWEYRIYVDVDRSGESDTGSEDGGGAASARSQSSRGSPSPSSARSAPRPPRSSASTPCGGPPKRSSFRKQPLPTPSHPDTAARSSPIPSRVAVYLTLALAVVGWLAASGFGCQVAGMCAPPAAAAAAAGPTVRVSVGPEACPPAAALAGEWAASGSLLGRTWYRHTATDALLYYDSSCDGALDTAPGWFVVPATQEERPLAGESCQAPARIPWDGAAFPYGAQTWFVDCSGGRGEQLEGVVITVAKDDALWSV